MLHAIYLHQVTSTMSAPYPNPNPTPSASFQQLHTLFHSLNRPYGAADIVRFNLVFHRVYPHLNPAEKRHTEDWADALIADRDDMGRVCRLGED